MVIRRRDSVVRQLGSGMRRVAGKVASGDGAADWARIPLSQDGTRRDNLRFNSGLQGYRPANVTQNAASHPMTMSRATGKTGLSRSMKSRSRLAKRPSRSASFLNRSKTEAQVGLGGLEVDRVATGYQQPQQIFHAGCSGILSPHLIVVPPSLALLSSSGRRRLYFLCRRSPQLCCQQRLGTIHARGDRAFGTL